MTGMDRVIAALQGKETDQRAFTMTLSLYGAKLTGCPITEYYTRPDSYLKGQAEVAEQFGPDIIFTPFALALEARAFGTEINFLPKHPPNVKKPFIRNPNEIGKIRVPDIERDENLRYLRTSARLLADHFKEAVPICGVLTSPMDLPATIMGADGWLDLLLFDPEKASAVIATMSEYFVKMANSMFDCGINFLAMAMVFTNPRIIFEKTIAEIIVPALADMFGKLKGPVVFHHGGVPLARYLRLYQSLPDIGGYVLDSRDDFSEARTIVGDKVLLMGNLDGPSLARISTSKAIEKARKILDDRKEDRHFIFATSAADVGWDTPIETITGVRDLMRHDGADHDR